ncbi:MAG: DUF2283 domain-containing protein [Candidatus Micrarchaeota archaeon]|nr:DUF2283 domain-containing protein [Candidatus Micrarchaeota archaeon]
MKISYDKQADAANIRFGKGNYHISAEIEEGIIVDYTKSGKIIGIEILNLSEKIKTGRS